MPRPGSRLRSFCCSRFSFCFWARRKASASRSSSRAGSVSTGLTISRAVCLMSSRVAWRGGVRAGESEVSFPCAGCVAARANSGVRSFVGFSWVRFCARAFLSFFCASRRASRSARWRTSIVFRLSSRAVRRSCCLCLRRPDCVPGKGPCRYQQGRIRQGFCKSAHPNHPGPYKSKR